MRLSHFLLVSSAMCLPLAAAMSISISYEALAAKSAPTAQTAVSKSTADSGNGDFVGPVVKMAKKRSFLARDWPVCKWDLTTNLSLLTKHKPF